eukprot:gene2236-17842_t
MPKSKKPQHVEDEQERRPPSLTLGCFIKDARSRRNQNVAANDNLVDSTDCVVNPTGQTLEAISGAKKSQAGYKELEKESGFQTFQVENSCTACATEERTDDLFKIMRTKKGGFPVYLEKRAKGKKVTVIRQVTGNSKHLLQLLKTKFGTGGLLKTGEVEIQGDFEEKVVKFLKENTQYMTQYKP